MLCCAATLSMALRASSRLAVTLRVRSRTTACSVCSDKYSFATSLPYLLSMSTKSACSRSWSCHAAVLALSDRNFARSIMLRRFSEGMAVMMYSYNGGRSTRWPVRLMRPRFCKSIFTSRSFCTISILRWRTWSSGTSAVEMACALAPIAPQALMRITSNLLFWKSLNMRLE